MSYKQENKTKEGSLTIGIDTYLRLIKWSLFKLVKPYKGSAKAYLKKLMRGRSKHFHRLLGENYHAFRKQCTEIIDLSSRAPTFLSVVELEQGCLSLQKSIDQAGSEDTSTFVAELQKKHERLKNVDEKLIAQRNKLAKLLDVNPCEVYKGEIVSFSGSREDLLAQIFCLDPAKLLMSSMNATGFSAISVASSLAIWRVMKIFLDQLFFSTDSPSTFYMMEFRRHYFTTEAFRKLCPNFDQSQAFLSPFSGTTQIRIKDDYFFRKGLFNYCLKNVITVSYSLLPFGFFKDFLLEHKNILDHPVNDSKTRMLMCVAADGRVDVCEFLLENGVSPYESDEMGLCALHCAILSPLNEKNTIRLLTKMLFLGGEIRDAYFGNHNLAEIALICKKTGVAIWLEQELKLVNKKRNRTLLTTALFKGDNLSIASIINSKTIVRSSDLRLTITFRNTKMFPIIFEKWFSSQENSPIIETLKIILNRAVTDNLPSCVEYIIKNSRPEDKFDLLNYAFLIAISVGNFTMALLLLELGASPNAHFHDDKYPLYKAVQAGSKKLVNALIKHKDLLLDKAFPNNDLLQHAIRFEHPHLVAMLIIEFHYLDKDPNNTNYIFREILETMPILSLVQACLRHGIDLDKQQGMTALAFAIYHDLPLDVLRLIAEHSKEIIDHIATIGERTYTLVELFMFHSDKNTLCDMLTELGFIKKVEPTLKPNNSLNFEIAIIQALRKTKIPPADQLLLQERLVKESDIRIEILHEHPIIVSYQTQRNKVLGDISNTDIVLSSEQQANIPLSGLERRLDRYREANLPKLIKQNSISKLSFFSQQQENVCYPGKLSFGLLSKHFCLVPIRKTDLSMCLVSDKLDEIMSDYNKYHFHLNPFLHIFEKPCLANQEGLKSIRQMGLSAKFTLNGTEKIFPIVYEMKTKSTADRILVAEMIPENGMGTVILMPVCLVKKGFHNNKYNSISIYQGGDLKILSQNEASSNLDCA